MHLPRSNWELRIIWIWICLKFRHECPMPVHHEGQGRKPGHGTSHSRETHLRRGTRHSYEFGGNIKLIDCAWFAQGGFISSYEGDGDNNNWHSQKSLTTGTPTWLSLQAKLEEMNTPPGCMKFWMEFDVQLLYPPLMVVKDFYLKRNTLLQGVP